MSNAAYKQSVQRALLAYAKKIAQANVATINVDDQPDQTNVESNVCNLQVKAKTKSKSRKNKKAANPLQLSFSFDDNKRQLDQEE